MANEKDVKPRARFGGGYYYKKNITHARDMRKELTPWELQLWLRLKGKQLGGYKFRRQQPVGRYIVDFICMEHKLIVELDGSQHVDSAEDKTRDAYLTKEGYRVMRFWNHEVNENLEGVLSTILSMLECTPHQNREQLCAENAQAADARFWLPPKGGATELAVPIENKISGIENTQQCRALSSSPLGGEPNPPTRILTVDCESKKGDLVGGASLQSAASTTPIREQA